MITTNNKIINGFKCQKCGNCCRWKGYVRLQNSEIDKISEFLNLNIDKFIDKYTRLTADRSGLSLNEYDDGKCIFLIKNSKGEEICKINEVKPQQCKNFPHFWQFDNWQDECAGGRLLKIKEK